MSTNIDYDVANSNKFLPESLRAFVGATNKVSREDFKAFYTMYSGVEQLAVFNNVYAAEFASGFVSSLNYKYLRSGVAPRLRNILVSKTVGRVYYQTEIDEKILNEKLDQDYFSDCLNKAFTEAADTGRSIMVLYQPSEEEEITIKTYNLFRHKIRFDKKKNIIDAVMFMSNREHSDKGSHYTIAEHRFYKRKLMPDGTYQMRPYQEFQVFKSEYDHLDQKDATVLTLDKNSIPDEIRDEYKNITFGVAKELTFENIGVFDIKFSIVNTKFIDSNIPEAMFVDAVDNAMVIDTTLTDKEVEKENGRGQILQPSFGRGDAIATPIQSMAGSKMMMTLGNKPKSPFVMQYPTMSMEDSKPSSIQFDIRSEQWIQQLNDDVARLCASVGVSVLDYDPRLLQAGQRTDDEINAMTDITSQTVMNLRNINTRAINKLLETVVVALGLEKPVAIRWSLASIMNPTKNADLVIKKLTSGLISRKRAIQELYPDLTPSEREQMFNEIMEEIENQEVSTQFSNF